MIVIYKCRACGLLVEENLKDVTEDQFLNRLQDFHLVAHLCNPRNHDNPVTGICDPVAMKEFSSF